MSQMFAFESLRNQVDILSKMNVHLLPVYIEEHDSISFAFELKTYLEAAKLYRCLIKRDISPDHSHSKYKISFGKLLGEYPIEILNTTCGSDWIDGFAHSIEILKMGIILHEVNDTTGCLNLNNLPVIPHKDEQMRFNIPEKTIEMRVSWQKEIDTYIEKQSLSSNATALELAKLEKWFYRMVVDWKACLLEGWQQSILIDRGLYPEMQAVLLLSVHEEAKRKQAYYEKLLAENSR